MSDQLPLVLRHLLGRYGIDTLALGRRSGALAVLFEEPGTAADIARRAGLDETNTAQWLRAMAAAEYVDHDAGVFSLTDETAMVLGPWFPIDFGAVLDFAHAAMADPLQRVAEAMREGGGIPSADFAAIGAAAGGVNSRLYRTALVDQWVGAVPGLADRLGRGARIADLACGNGDAAAMLAEAFPSATVTGYDPGVPAHHDGPANLSLVARGVDQVAADGPFELITCLDALHHVGDAESVVREVFGALSPGGVLLVAETKMTGDLDVDNADPTALIAHAAGLIYCLQENLANGGTGTIPSAGLGWVDAALVAAGFGTVDHLDSDTGYRVFIATR